ncbi:DUF5693 family protein [Paenibacillus sp.]|uniref:DUF5693 family protein n=1 Tax=Paenibacillus sp. TaxID=58172 RepID=UPI002D2DB2B5|nr:DUF5693 family protein [Paenibacillus sp.]HZG87368.1 DUF5693 family protein [Paenibacillus sp.]
MLSLFEKWGRGAKLALWTLAIAGVLASIPFAFVRHGVEQTADRVEFVFDYRDLLEVASYRSKPSEYTLERLLELKAAGVHSMAVYESTLRELELSGRVQTLSSAEAAMLTEFRLAANEKSTYVLFLGEASQEIIRPIVEGAFERLGVDIAPWSYGDIPGIEISMPKDEAMLQALDPDPITMSELQALGFHLVVRLSDQWQPFDAARMDELLARLAAHGVTRIVFEGGSVTGATDDPELKSLTAMAELMNKYGIGLATIEMAKPQVGLGKLAHLTNYNVVRLHSLPANMSSMAPEDLADRFALAAQDRNIRMIFLNTAASLDTSLGIRKDTVGNLVKSLEGENGALARIRDNGFTLGAAEPFRADAGLPGAVSMALKAMIVLGAVALIALLIGAFFPLLLLPAFAVGLVGSAGLLVLSTTLLSQGLALGVGIASATLATLYAVRRAAESGERGDKPVALAVKLLAGASAISFIGIAYIVGLLDHITYLYVLRQYRGVSLLHLAPIAFAFAYVCFFHGETSLRGVLRRVRSFLMLNVTVLWVAAAAVAGAAVMYYLSRTGNAGTTTGLERAFRDALQDALGVRPRTKEFLFAHPIFVLGVYLAASARKRLGMALIALGSIGQLSMVDTFAHLHTPLTISLIRVGYGLLFGLLIGLVLIAVWKLFEKGWARWGSALKP